MTREEFYTQRRIFRTALKSFEIPLEYDYELRNKVWMAFWKGLVGQVDESVYKSLLARRKSETPHEITNIYAVRCNHIHLPNSYPHKTKNP